MDGKNFIPFVAIFVTEQPTLWSGSTGMTSWLSRHWTRDSSTKVWLTTVNRGTWSNSLHEANNLKEILAFVCYESIVNKQSEKNIS